VTQNQTLRSAEAAPQTPVTDWLESEITWRDNADTSTN